MRQFQVPQFIEVEDKIFGPLTLKQFMYVLGGAASIFLLYVFLPLWLTVILGIPVGAFFLALAFYKVNGRPFIIMLESALGHYTQTRLYIWKKTPTHKRVGAPTGSVGVEQDKNNFQLPKLTESKLKDLSWSLDIQEKLQR